MLGNPDSSFRLANKNREVIKITPDGWEIISDPPYNFIRPPRMKALPYPEELKVEDFRLKQQTDNSE